jgi:hypothetical protein
MRGTLLYYGSYCYLRNDDDEANEDGEITCLDFVMGTDSLYIHEDDEPHRGEYDEDTLVIVRPAP